MCDLRSSLEKSVEHTQYNIYTYQISRFLHFSYVARTHTKNANSTNYVCIIFILNNGGQKIFISSLLCVWLAQFFPRLTDLFFNRKVFSLNKIYVR